MSLWALLRSAVIVTTEGAYSTWMLVYIAVGVSHVTQSLVLLEVQICLAGAKWLEPIEVWSAFSSHASISPCLMVVVAPAHIPTGNLVAASLALLFALDAR